jgi:hypothetical protein
VNAGDVSLVTGGGPVLIVVVGPTVSITRAREAAVPMFPTPSVART